MTDAISRKATAEWLKRYLDSWPDRHQCCYEIENEIPALDAVPVVRCKDCKHWRPCAGATEHVKCCEFAGYMVGANGYCVYGEKRAEDTDGSQTD